MNRGQVARGIEYGSSLLPIEGVNSLPSDTSRAQIRQIATGGCAQAQREVAQESNEDQHQI